MTGNARNVVLAVLDERKAGATVCPSEVARAMIPAPSTGVEAGWRAAMPVVHAAVDQLVDQGIVSLIWKGRALPSRSGPYRIARALDSMSDG
jgi:hypothetical protein